MKKLIALILACAMVTSLAACSGGNSTSSTGSQSSKAAESAAAPSGAKTKITILGTLKDEVAEPFKQEMAEYNKSQDKYEISSIPLDGTDRKSVV